MKKALLLPLVCYCAVSVAAQEKFYGTIQYERGWLGPERNTTDTPVKWTVTYAPSKLLVNGMYAVNYNLANYNIWQLYDFTTDTMYTVHPARKTFYKWPYTTEKSLSPNLERTDSVKDILGYRCRAFKISTPGFRDTGLAWLAEDLLSVYAGKEGTVDYIFPSQAGGHVVLGFIEFRKGAPYSYFMASDIQKMNEVPEAAFDLSHFTEVPNPLLKLLDRSPSLAPYKPLVLKLVKKKTRKKGPAKKKAAAVKTKQ